MAWPCIAIIIINCAKALIPYTVQLAAQTMQEVGNLLKIIFMLSVTQYGNEGV